MKLLFSQIGQKTKKFSVGAQHSELNIFESTWLKPCITELELNSDNFTGELALQETSGGEIQASLTCDMTPTLECVRCLAKYKLTLNQRYEGVFKVVGNESSSEERDLDEMSLYDVEKNQVLPWEEFVLDGINESLPDRPLCKALCLGLCASCGANKNTELCSCATSAPFH
jgi:uncharacterized metal-binding protein YceD (DUF177 family)